MRASGYSRDFTPEFIDLPSKDFFGEEIRKQLDAIEAAVGGGFSIANEVVKEDLLVSGMIHENYVLVATNESRHFGFCFEIDRDGVEVGIDGAFDCFGYPYEKVICGDEHFRRLVKNLVARPKIIRHSGEWRKEMVILNDEGEPIEEYQISTSIMSLLPKFLDFGSSYDERYEPIWTKR